jgi:hypothetical protein
MDLGQESGREPAIFNDDLATLENEGETFEAISVMSFIMGAASAVATGTFFYLERTDPVTQPATPAPPATTMRTAGQP